MHFLALGKRLQLGSGLLPRVWRGREILWEGRELDPIPRLKPSRLEALERTCIGLATDQTLNQRSVGKGVRNFILQPLWTPRCGAVFGISPIHRTWSSIMVSILWRQIMGIERTYIHFSCPEISLIKTQMFWTMWRGNLATWQTSTWLFPGERTSLDLHTLGNPQWTPVWSLQRLQG